MITEKLRQLQTLNETISKELKILIEELCEQIANQTSLGTVISNNPQTISVKFSTISSNDKYILSPEYYLSNSQAEAVRKVLSTSSDYKAILTRVSNMTTERKVCIGKEWTLLNNKTISCIENSQLWKVAQEFKNEIGEM